MPHLISNLVEKGFTPFTARLAPKNLWSRPALGKSYSFIFLRSQARKANALECRSHCEGFLEIHQNLGLP